MPDVSAIGPLNTAESSPVHFPANPLLCQPISNLPPTNIYVTSSVPAKTAAAVVEFHHCTFEGCDKKFTLKSNMRRHMQTHSGIKPFSCTVCSRKFFRKADLQTHHRTHTGEKPLGCTMCPRRFARISDLRSHERTHTGERAHVCDVEGCNRSFTRKFDLSKHKSKHNKANEEQQALALATVATVVSDDESSSGGAETEQLGNSSQSPVKEHDAHAKQLATEVLLGLGLGLKS
ncbi:hypothetical protein TrST_g5611 [Triparma strigata]|uniref:C2H2-type domain-containing protein n=1 Tax=Triparma strigata TaxID=1606541 RepID=A0A9W7DRF4_9STRA|nr:hypothetical protein TrST_g5611 [Triparma strigata]